MNKEKYEPAELEIIVFYTEDVIGISEYNPYSEEDETEIII